jgi:hypothetical protein
VSRLSVEHIGKILSQERRCQCGTVSSILELQFKFTSHVVVIVEDIISKNLVLYMWA